jgi:hypothetical protein
MYGGSRRICAKLDQLSGVWTPRRRKSIALSDWSAFRMLERKRGVGVRHMREAPPKDRRLWTGRPPDFGHRTATASETRGSRLNATERDVRMRIGVGAAPAAPLVRKRRTVRGAACPPSSRLAQERGSEGRLPLVGERGNVGGVSGTLSQVSRPAQLRLQCGCVVSAWSRSTCGMCCGRLESAPPLSTWMGRHAALSPNVRCHHFLDRRERARPCRDVMPCAGRSGRSLPRVLLKTSRTPSHGAVASRA